MKCKTMMLDLSEKEMLDLWKLKTGFMQARNDCSVEREDSVDLDGKLMVDIRQWYANLLKTAPADWLPVEDVTDEIFTDTDVDGTITVTLPDNCVRPLAWHVEGWATDVAEFYEPNSVVGKQQTVEWLRGTESHPVAILTGVTLRLYSVAPGAGGAVDKALCVVKPTDGTYQFSEEALSTIPQN